MEIFFGISSSFFAISTTSFISGIVLYASIKSGTPGISSPSLFLAFPSARSIVNLGSVGSIFKTLFTKSKGTSYTLATSRIAFFAFKVPKVRI